MAGNSQVDTAITPVERKLQPGPYKIVLKANGYNEIMDSLYVIKDSLTQKMYKLSHTKEFLDSVAFAKKQASKTFRNIRRILFASLAVTTGGVGYLFEREANKNYNYYQKIQAGAPASEFDNAWSYFEDNSTKRNICYVLSGISCGLFLISIPF
jgi:hypothetical protein